MGRIKATEVAIPLMELGNDLEVFTYCQDGRMETSTIALATAEAMRVIQGETPREQ